MSIDRNSLLFKQPHLARTAEQYSNDKITSDSEMMKNYRQQHLNETLWFNLSLKQAYCGLPKNGCISTSESFRKAACNGWTNNLHQFSDVDTLVITLRDPVSRFKSNINMYLEMTQNIDSFKGSWLPFDMLSGEQSDYHFSTQKYLIDILDIPKSVEIKYVYMKGNLIDELNKYFNWNLPVLHEHKSALNLITDVNEELVKKWYQDDYDLIESVEFVNR